MLPGKGIAGANNTNGAGISSANLDSGACRVGTTVHVLPCVGWAAPVMAQERKGTPRARPRATCTTCWHSSAVGVSTSARGAFLRWGSTSGEEASCARRRCTRGARYASVLPLPAWSAISRLLRPCSMACTRQQPRLSGALHGARGRQVSPCTCSCMQLVHSCHAAEQSLHVLQGSHHLLWTRLQRLQAHRAMSSQRAVLAHACTDSPEAIPSRTLHQCGHRRAVAQQPEQGAPGMRPPAHGRAC